MNDMQRSDGSVAANSPAATIRALNDHFRLTLAGGTIMMTAGILSLGGEAQQAILTKVREFHAFDDGNDPYGEHDVGSFEHAGERVAFKIDYFDRTLTYGSPDPADPSITRRVMTIMLLSEW